MQDKQTVPSRRNNILFTVLLCAVGLLINFLGAKLALALNLPLYLDIIGSALTAALGGYIPAIIVGFFTNLINGIGDYTTTYYGSLSVLIAVSAAYYASKGYFARLSRLPLIILTFSLIGGGLGSALTWALYGFDFGTGISAPLAHRIFEAGTLNQFWSQFTADMLIDLLDKTITVVIVALALRLLPGTVKSRCYFTGWQQAPLGRGTHQLAEKHLARKASLRAKVVLVVSAAMVIIAVAVTGISFIHFREAAVSEKTCKAQSAAMVAKSYIDAERVDEFISQGKAAAGYAETAARLQVLRDAADDISYVYVYRILEDGCHVVFDADTADTPGSAPGEVIPFDDAFRQYVPALLAGEKIAPVESNETYGWLLSVYEPVYDAGGVCRCYAAVDIDMSSIAVSGWQFLARVVSLFFGFFVMILTIAIWLAEYGVILPINAMALTTDQYSFETKEARAEAVKQIKELDIATGDEIENLYRSVVKTTEDVVKNIEQVEQQKEIISKLQNGLILVLADMVESRDKCTGDHVRKTAAYADVIMRQLKKEGVYTDHLTDRFMEDVVNSAPLHDVGKIHVPDSVLNKPGRLTDEEFDQIKQHTTSGSEIISRAIDMVSEGDEGFLKEAKNLALYHHEKWNGLGYPQGLKGEEIPLSARVMAVADVFDALVSRRSYKEGLSMEQAMDIIHQGSGAHFDPRIVKAFEDARDEVEQIMQSHKEQGIG